MTSGLAGAVSTYGLVIGMAFAAGLIVGLLIYHRAGGLAFWVGVFSDGGYPSFSRISSAFVLIVACGWISRALVNHEADLSSVAALLREVTPFLASTLALTYGVNKIGAAVGAIKGTGNGKGPNGGTGGPATPPGAAPPGTVSQISNAQISNSPPAPGT